MSGSNLSNDTWRAAPAEHGALEQPLGLTVHALPTPEQALGAQARRTLAGRWKMLLVLLVCAAPVIASYFTYYVIRPEGRRNFGELIEPQRPLPALTALDLDGRPLSLDSLRGQWLLLSVGPAGNCDAACVQRLYLQRQLRESLGQDKERIDRVWLVSDDAPLPPHLLPGLHGATVLRVAPAELARWLAPAPGHQLQEHLYLVDPLGNWMMRFAPDLDIRRAAQVKRDLERLMRASASWDRPGR